MHSVNSYQDIRTPEDEEYENEELEAQIEKMKCCRNCKYDGGLVCLYKTDCKNRDKWELSD